MKPRLQFPRPNRLLLALAVAALVVTAGCLGTANATPAAGSGDDVAGDTATVGGSGHVSTDPDRVLVTVAVVAEADTAEAVRDRAATDTDRLLAALDEAGVGEDEVETLSYRLSPVYDYSDRENGRELVGYEVVHTLQVASNNVTQAGVLVDTAVDNGASRVDGVQFTLREETRESLRSEAVTDAMASAQRDAAAAAQAAGRSLDGVARVHVGNDGTVVPYYVRGADAAEAATSLSPGPVSVTATVEVTYRLN